jgi:hypothetical protein
MRVKHWLLILLELWLVLALPVMAEPSFPFNEVQQLTPEQMLVQKYKLQRLRIKEMQNHWLIMRGVNDKVDDVTLLKLLNKTEVLRKVEQGQNLGNMLSLSGLGLMAGGGLLAGNIFKFEGSLWIGIAGLIAGGALVLTGEMMAGNIGDEFSHILERIQAEQYVAEYNEELKKKLGITHVPNLE